MDFSDLIICLADDGYTDGVDSVFVSFCVCPGLFLPADELGDITGDCDSCPYARPLTEAQIQEIEERADNWLMDIQGIL